MKKAPIILLLSMLIMPYASAKVREIRSEKHLDRVLDKYDEVAIKFYIPECPICERHLENLGEISNKEEFEHIKFYKINTKKYPEVGKEYKAKEGRSMDFVAIKKVMVDKPLTHETPKELEEKLEAFFK